MSRNSFLDVHVTVWQRGGYDADGLIAVFRTELNEERRFDCVWFFLLMLIKLDHYCFVIRIVIH